MLQKALLSSPTPTLLWKMFCTLSEVRRTETFRNRIQTLDSWLLFKLSMWPHCWDDLCKFPPTSTHFRFLIHILTGSQKYDLHSSLLKWHVMSQYCAWTSFPTFNLLEKKKDWITFKKCFYFLPFIVLNLKW